MKKTIKSIIKNTITKTASILYLFFFLGTNVIAKEASDFYIIPWPEDRSDVIKHIENISDSKCKGNVSDCYNQAAKEISDKGEIGNAISSGIMTRDTIMDYILYVASFLSQIGLLIGALMIIYAWYIYGTAIFNGGNASKWKEAISKAIIGVTIVVFGYAIPRILTRTFIA